MIHGYTVSPLRPTVLFPLQSGFPYTQRSKRGFIENYKDYNKVTPTHFIDSVSYDKVMFSLGPHLPAVFLHDTDDDGTPPILIILIRLIDVDTVLRVDVEGT